MPLGSYSLCGVQSIKIINGKPVISISMPFHIMWKKKKVGKLATIYCWSTYETPPRAVTVHKSSAIQLYEKHVLIEIVLAPHLARIGKNWKHFENKEAILCSDYDHRFYLDIFRLFQNCIYCEYRIKVWNQRAESSGMDWIAYCMNSFCVPAIQCCMPLLGTSDCRLGAST